MKALTNTLKTALSNVVLFAAACVMAGVGFAFVATLAVFAFFAMGVALFAAPFVGLSQSQDAAPDSAEAAA